MSLNNHSTLCCLIPLLDQQQNPSALEHICNQIDDILTDVVLSSEEKVQRCPHQTPPWSLQYKQARDAVRYWKKQL